LKIQNNNKNDKSTIMLVDEPNKLVFEGNQNNDIIIFLVKNERILTSSQIAELNDQVDIIYDEVDDLFICLNIKSILPVYIVELCWIKNKWDFILE